MKGWVEGTAAHPLGTCQGQRFRSDRIGRIQDFADFFLI